MKFTAVTVIGACLVVACQGLFILPGLLAGLGPAAVGTVTLTSAEIAALLGIAGLKGAAIVGLLGLLAPPPPPPAYPGHHKRSVENQEVAIEGLDMMLSTVIKMDKNGCVRKLVCSLNQKNKEDLTFNELAIVDLFPAETEGVSEAHKIFMEAAGIKAMAPQKCDEIFDQCPLASDDLQEILRASWGCGM